MIVNRTLKPFRPSVELASTKGPSTHADHLALLEEILSRFTDKSASHQDPEATAMYEEVANAFRNAANARGKWVISFEDCEIDVLAELPPDAFKLLAQHLRGLDAHRDCTILWTADAMQWPLEILEFARFENTSESCMLLREQCRNTQLKRIDFCAESVVLQCESEAGRLLLIVLDARGTIVCRNAEAIDEQCQLDRLPPDVRLALAEAFVTADASSIIDKLHHFHLAFVDAWAVADYLCDQPQCEQFKGSAFWVALLIETLDTDFWHANASTLLKDLNECSSESFSKAFATFGDEWKRRTIGALHAHAGFERFEVDTLFKLNALARALTALRINDDPRVYDELKHFTDSLIKWVDQKLVKFLQVTSISTIMDGEDHLMDICDATADQLLSQLAELLSFETEEGGLRDRASIAHTGLVLSTSRHGKDVEPALHRWGITSATMMLKVIERARYAKNIDEDDSYWMFLGECISRFGSTTEYYAGIASIMAGRFPEVCTFLQRILPPREVSGRTFFDSAPRKESTDWQNFRLRFFINLFKERVDDISISTFEDLYPEPLGAADAREHLTSLKLMFASLDALFSPELRGHTRSEIELLHLLPPSGLDFDIFIRGNAHGGFKNLSNKLCNRVGPAYRQQVKPEDVDALCNKLQQGRISKNDLRLLIEEAKALCFFESLFDRCITSASRQQALAANLFWIYTFARTYQQDNIGSFPGNIPFYNALMTHRAQDEQLEIHRRFTRWRGSLDTGAASIIPGFLANDFRGFKPILMDAIRHSKSAKKSDTQSALIKALLALGSHLPWYLKAADRLLTAHLHEGCKLETIVRVCQVVNTFVLILSNRPEGTQEPALEALIQEMGQAKADDPTVKWSDDFIVDQANALLTQTYKELFRLSSEHATRIALIFEGFRVPVTIPSYQTNLLAQQYDEPADAVRLFARNLVEGTFPAVRYQPPGLIFAKLDEDRAQAWRTGHRQTLDLTVFAHLTKRSLAEKSRAIIAAGFGDGHLDIAGMTTLNDFLDDDMDEGQARIKLLHDSRSPEPHADLQLALIDLMTNPSEQAVANARALLLKLPAEPELLNDVAAVEHMLVAQKSAGAGKPELVEIFDTDDAELLFRMGTDVPGSCMRIDGQPKLNRALIGTVLHGDSRMLAIVKERQIQTRALIRLMKDSNDVPCLFLERIYPEGASPSAVAAVRHYAQQRASSLGLSLFAAHTNEPRAPGSRLISGEVPVPIYVDARRGIAEGMFDIPDAQSLFTYHRA